MRRIAILLPILVFCAGTAGASLPVRASSNAITPSAYADLRWRFIGPLRGGRTSAVAGVADKPSVYYMAAVNGGIWKTDDAGRTWTPIFDNQDTGSIGALAVAPSDDNVIYAGSGEGLHRPDLAVGDGMYKSTDGGAHWTHLGLRDAQQIAAIAVDPHDANRLFVAVLGHPYGPNAERGVYRSLDGGATFQRVLYENENTGAFDVTIDPQNPQTVYATLWAAREAPWEASFEIPGSGIFKSTDGGTTWMQLRAGLPRRIGRAYVAVAPSAPEIVYAIVDAPTGCGFYRSTDDGAHFVLRNAHANIAQRCDDLTTIGVNPRDADDVWLTNTSTYRSHDGGRTFVAVKGAPGGDDYHVIWINPKDPDLVILGSDQGATLSLNGGRTWSSWYNQPTAQMFHVSADNRFPYWVCGGQQESGSACVRSRGDWGEITERDWHPVGAEEYGYVVADPLHPGVFFGGKVERFDESTGQTQEVSPSPLRGGDFRVVRTEPLAFDPRDPQALYFGANRLYVTRDGGRHWRVVSPDLTRRHPGVPAVVGPFERDDPEHGRHRGVLYALALSRVHEGTIWAGTDDGLVWLTRDGGHTWRRVTPPGMTPWSKVAQIDASPVHEGTAYVAVTRFRLDDLRPYVYVTHDFGAHWRLAVSGLPRWPVNAVRVDPRVPGLLYAATENGVFVSFDDGWRWQSLQLNVPHTSVRDLIVHGDDLAVATHGRGFWILDDVEPLRELGRSGLPDGVHLFTPQTAIRIRRSTNTDTPLPPEEPMGENPPSGAFIDYYLPRPVPRVVIEIRNRDGSLVRRYASDERPPAIPELDKPLYWLAPFEPPAAGPGMHRFVWDFHEAPPPSDMRDLPISAVPHRTPLVPQGALVPPGSYTVRLLAGGKSLTAQLTVTLDPRVRVSQSELEHQYRLAHGLAALIGRASTAARAAQAAHRAARSEALETLEAKAIFLLDVVDGADAPVTQAAQDAYCGLGTQAARLGVRWSTQGGDCAHR
jgi:photosystem II stability/assembly factor-like uncharacterized protein